MKALVYDAYGGLDAMRLADMPEPGPGPGDVLVEVRAASVNPIDWKVRNGLERSHARAFRARLSRHSRTRPVGSGRRNGATEFSAGGPGVRRPPSNPLGQPCGAGRGRRRRSSRKTGLHAAPLAGHTAPTALDGAVEEGMQVLVHAAAGGVGAFAVQYCVSRRAAVHAAASARNAEFVRSLAPTRSSITRPRISATRFRISTSSTVGGDVHLRSQSALKPGGLLVCLNAAPVPDGPRREDIRVSTPPVAYERAGMKRIAAPLEEGAARPTVGETFALDRAVEAYRLSETGHVRGKIVIRRNPSGSSAGRARAGRRPSAHANSAGSFRRSRVG